jgi:Protein of unknown function (DUF3551)
MKKPVAHRVFVIAVAPAWALAAGLLLFAPPPAAAYFNLPWCAQYADRSYARTCAFVTYQACVATLSGIGGYCFSNPSPLPPPPAPAYRRPKPRR